MRFAPLLLLRAERRGLDGPVVVVEERWVARGQRVLVQHVQICPPGARAAWLYNVCYAHVYMCMRKHDSRAHTCACACTAAVHTGVHFVGETVKETATKQATQGKEVRHGTQGKREVRHAR
jgi:hypothetical protein